MKVLFLMIVLVFTVALAVVVGSRLPVDAVTVMVGVVCGVLASIPTSLLLLSALGRRERGHDQGFGAQQQSYPPVVVVNSPPPGAAMNGQMWQGQGGPWNMAPPPVPRQFRIIGQDSEMMDGGRYSDL